MMLVAIRSYSSLLYAILRRHFSVLILFVRRTAMKAVEEPLSRVQLVAYTRQRSPAWSTLGAHVDDACAASWTTALLRFQRVEAFLERVFRTGPFHWGERKTHAYFIILESCALHLDYMVFLRHVAGDAKKVASLRSIFTKTSSTRVSKDTEAPCEEDEVGVIRLLSTLIREESEERTDKLLLLDVWSSGTAPSEYFLAAAAAHSMMFVDFLKDCGRERNEGPLLEVCRMVIEAAVAVRAERPLPTWFAPMAAMTIGIKSKPSPRC
jgi:hypothetical protein